MPSVSNRQRRFFGAELARLRGGNKTKTGLDGATLSEFAGSVRKKKKKVRRLRDL